MGTVMEAPYVEKQEVRAVIAQINRGWREREFSVLPDCFAENAVMLGPGYTVLGRGRSFLVESYHEFATNAAVLQYTESEPLVEVFDSVAICAYTWTMTYRRADQPETESGSDQFVLSRSGSQWRVVCRYMSFEPST
jgi:hypothetical protein